MIAAPGTPKRRPLGPTVIALAVVSLLTDVSSDMIYPLLPGFLAGTLGVSAAFIGVIEGAAESTAALLKLASGWWSDRLPRRKPLVVAGYAIAALARPLVALATSGAQVLAIRMADRVGKGIRSSPRDALIADSVDARDRGRAYGVHRAADNAGAVAGPLIAFALLGVGGLSLRTVFAIAAVPGLIAVVVVVLRVRDEYRAPHAVPRALVTRHGEADASERAAPPAEIGPVEGVATRTGDEPLAPFAPGFRVVMGAVLLFTLGNSTDAFLLLRATSIGVSMAQLPLLWAMFNGIKALASTPGGALSDRIGRRPVVIAGWLMFALTYAGFARVTGAWQVWALFAVYGVTFGLTEGTEKALVADLTPSSRRGAAFGWYNLVIGIGALPASVLFGVLWNTAGPTAAFFTGAALALVAAVVLHQAPILGSGAAPARGG